MSEVILNRYMPRRKKDLAWDRTSEPEMSGDEYELCDGWEWQPVVVPGLEDFKKSQTETNKVIRALRSKDNKWRESNSALIEQTKELRACLREAVAILHENQRLNQQTGGMDLDELKDYVAKRDALLKLIKESRDKRWRKALGEEG